ncbi:hypothetical protein GQ53DRAFT_709444 [Thozetella sp. PMI_491]|nr:hypothetical protein GQ53DRAFT_709444 [Thozetella sp. PMI_491]
MEVVNILLHTFTAREIFRGLVLCALLQHFVQPNSPVLWRSSWKANVLSFGGVFFVYLFGRAWLALVGEYVPEPYLDEVFHIPQAQTYCRGRYFDWDDKITTPPGLSHSCRYILGVLFNRLRMGAECTAFSLRGLNVPAVVQAALIASVCRNSLEARASDQEGKARSQTFSLYSYHTSLNIALFPALFFFSALFYTDVTSTLVVLIAYNNHLTRLSEKTGLLNDLWTVVLGVFTLFMRQTNVFWVVVYMGGLEAIHAVQSLQPGQAAKEQASEATLFGVVQGFILRSWQGYVHDPPLSISYPDDYIFCVISYGIAALANLPKVLKQIWPQITILGLFAGFVAWNGSVVLGDKSNHIATLHLTQMLYIWPFFAFFSAPLVVKSLLLAILDGLFARKLYYLPYLFATVLISLAIVHFNTIIHPFTLADNRHYMFYVFRYTIRRPGATRYMLVAAYTISRWLVWGRLSGASPDSSSEEHADTKLRESPASVDAVTLGLLDEPVSTSASPPLTSTVLLWLLTTTLSLVTAPLVEPRYFILPWVFWRVLVPAWSSNSLSRQVDLTLVLETVWFLAINMATIYIFLFKPYVWRNEEGEVLDMGRLQRFMW